MANIFQISKELLDVFEQIEENDGELTEELEAKLTVSQSDFKFKVKSLGDGIKYLKSEIDAINKEITRLKALKESKTKTIDRLEKIIIWAVDMFGESTKSGGKFIDFGTGKVNVRNTEKVEVEKDVIDAAINNVFSYVNMLNYTRQLDDCDGIDCKELINGLNEGDTPVVITEDELYNLQASLTFDVNLKDLLYGEGFEFIRHFIKFVQAYKATNSITKTALKRAIEDNNADLHNIARVVQNKTVTIK